MLTTKAFEVAAGQDAVEFCYAQGWTDGLPVVPPTEDRVVRMLAGTARPPQETVAWIPPRRGRGTVERIAINAVMAGCRPEYMPLLMAAVEAMADPAFNLNGVQVTTHVTGPLLIVNGPVARDLDVNAGPNVFGPGWRANATIGRAVRLILLNIGGAQPGVLDRSTLGHPGKYTYCIAENEAASPWDPFHVARGCRPDESAVTVFAAEAPHSVSNHVSHDARGILTSIADSLATLGSNNMFVMGEAAVVIGPEHAATIRKDGLTRRDVQEFLFARARRRLADLTFHGAYGKIYNRNWPAWVNREDPDEMVPAVERPEDFLVLVAGGPAGRFSAVIPGWAHWSRAVTRPIAECVLRQAQHVLSPSKDGLRIAEWGTGVQELGTAVRVYEPVAEAEPEALHLAAPMADPRGKVVGLLDNGKWNAGKLLAALGEGLRRAHGVADVVVRKKPTFSRPADEELLAELGETCDAVVTAIGD
ncbi:MAG TPA: hypothetical protein VIG69_09230 [Candidatus Methylomirabilis sp.]